MDRRLRFTFSSLMAAVLVAGLMANGLLVVLVEASEDDGPAVTGFVSASNGLPSGESHFSVWFGDINNDTNLDIATAGYFGVKVWTGDGAGTWTLAANGLPDNAYDGGVFLGDINNDGDLDIAATNYAYGSGGVSVWTGDGAGTWTLANTGLPTTSMRTGIFLADVNHDDNLDLAVANDGGGVEVYLGNGAGSWTESSTNLPTTGKYFSVWMDDVNHDNHTDLAVAGAGMHVWLGDGTGGWTEASNGLPWTDQWNSVTLGDLNLDGHLDLVAAMDQDGHGLRAWLGDGTSNWTLASSGLPTTGTYYGVILADMVGDKYPDILTAKYTSGGIQIWKGDGGDSWTDASLGLPTGSVIGVTAGDIDGDGYLDIGAAGEGFGVRVLKNDETAPPLTVEVDEPNGGESWDALTQHYINWTASGGTPPLTIRIEYSVSGLFGPYAEISDDEANDGSYLWTVNNTPSADCYVRVNVTDSTAKTNWDKSNGSFTIIGVETDPPVISDLQPANGSVIGDTTPGIGASYSDASGIDTGSVVLRVDGFDITAQATVTPSDVTYTPSPPLPDGIHDVSLEVRDASLIHNLATESWSFTVDTQPPQIADPRPWKTIISDDSPGIAANYTDPSGVNSSAVTLQLDAVDVTASATVTGTSITYTSAPLTEGPHWVDLDIEDLSSPPNTATESWWFVVDTVPPDITNLQPVNQSIVSDDTPTIGADFSDDSSIFPQNLLLEVDGVDVTNSSTITFSDIAYAPASPLSEGPHTVSLHAGDNSTPMNVAVRAWWFAVDTLPPTITDPQPANQSTIADDTPTISASYGDLSGIDISTVVLEVDSVDVTAQATVEFDRVTYLVPSPMADGPHDVYVEVLDNSSPANVAKKMWLFTIDTSIIDPDPPTISDLQPADLSIVSDSTPGIGASYTDVSGIDTASVLLRVDGFDVTAQATVTLLDVTYTPSSPLSEGVHSVYLEVADDSPGQNIATETWSFTVDTVEPSISNLQPSDQSVISDSTPAIGASYGDDSGIDLASVVLLVDSIDVTASAAVGVNQVVYVPSSLSEGIHDVYLEVKDQATPQNTATMTWWFTVDTLPPVISNAQPAHMSTIPDTTPTIGVSFNDATGIDLSSVRVVVDAVDVTGSATVTSGGATYVPIAPLTNGIHTVHVEVSDTSSPQNPAEENWYFTIDTTMLDVTPPEIAGAQPVDGSTVSDSTPVIGATYSDENGIDEGSVVLEVDSVDISSLATVTSSGVTYTPMAPLSEGTHTVLLEVEDDSSNRNKATETWWFTVDTVTPAITDLQPIDLATIGETKPLVSASYTDDSGIDVSSVTLKVDSVDVTASATVTANSMSYTPASALSEGTHNVYLEVKDQSTPQNVATVTWQFTVDTSPPTISNMLPVNGSTLSDNTPTISATYSDASGIDTTSVALKLASADVTGSAVVTGSAITLTFLMPLEDGTYTVYLEVEDLVDPPNRAVVAWVFTVAVAQDDTDHDGLPDDWEGENFGDLSQGADDDPDSDGLSNLQEYSIETDPNDADTDGDGIRDGNDPNPLVAEEGGGFEDALFWAALIALLAITTLLILLMFWRKKEPPQEETEDEADEDVED
ncbi:MAG: FG-GAP-like repeat-containing protein [Candidatus Thermoplasmatota archaeon]|nr:FG-GAP-like repeat-containing protein [Candidatus Thermoplasmatota archaeon]